MKLDAQKRHAPHMSQAAFDELQFEREGREDPFAGRDGHPQQPPPHELMERHAHMERDLHSDHERLMERDAMLVSASEERAAMHNAEMEKVAAEHEQQRRLAMAQPQYEPPKVTPRQILDRDRDRTER